MGVVQINKMIDQHQKQQLNFDEVHIWRFDLDKETAYLNEYSTVLAPSEHDVINRLIQPLHRQRALSARIQLRVMLASYLNVTAEEISFSKGEFGKPYIEASEYAFNLSHSQNVALLAVSREPNIGVDIECWRPLDNREGIVQRHYSTLEKQQWQTLADEVKEKVFFDNWTRKEAFIKATGRGLGMGLSSCSFDLLGGSGLLECSSEYGSPNRWSTQHIGLDEAMSATLIFEKEPDVNQGKKLILRHASN